MCPQMAAAIELDDSLVDLTEDTPPTSSRKRSRQDERQTDALGGGEGGRGEDTEAISQLLELGTGSSRATVRALLAHFSYAGPEGSVARAAAALLDGTVEAVLRDTGGGSASAHISASRDADTGSSEALARALMSEDDSERAQTDLALAARLAREDTAKGEQASQLLASTMLQDGERMDAEFARKLEASLRSSPGAIACSFWLSDCRFLISLMSVRREFPSKKK